MKKIVRYLLKETPISVGSKNLLVVAKASAPRIINVAKDMMGI